ncbi:MULTISPECIES: hypothetical protein [unclassified Lentimonas]|uniref:hypothetical protein n=1 Tax=unclassified Lentimonas TaxID=2630993 RepID=UPI0013223D7B|nr:MULTISPECIES: hypothetical protein [unclassified Lentimonas]CAA6676802.1 Unannotated [Lentimonas sp. CC4]CAA6686609.1 Unannotated [Lentimonas sp. CC6]CAA7075814.1 Unannotated [Lentimonas sp. CC4]CAA7183033.1 Unannotated [Lentimonas sp. CC8]
MNRQLHGVGGLLLFLLGSPRRGFACEDRERCLGLRIFETSRQFAGSAPRPRLGLELVETASSTPTDSRGRSNLCSFLLLLLVVLVSPVAVHAQSSSGIRVIEESAIPYAGFLSRANFDQRFPGQMKSGPADLDSGWYVIYEHESLSYYFGPILLESTGQDYLEQLRKTVDAAVQQRPTITDYRLELSFEPSASASQGSENDSDSEDPDSDYGSPPPPEPSTDIWTLIRGVFGF